MYAVIEDGGKQYLVNEGDVIQIELRDLPEQTDQLQFEKVLLVSDAEKTDIGRPFVKGAKVTARVEAQVAGPKLVIYKYRRRKSSHSKKGHRQKYLRVVIERIFPGK